MLQYIYITSTSVKVKEMLNYFLHQKLIIKPTATESLTSRKVHLLLFAYFIVIFSRKGINDRDNNLFYLECFLETYIFILKGWRFYLFRGFIYQK